MRGAARRHLVVLPSGRTLPYCTTLSGVAFELEDLDAADAAENKRRAEQAEAERGEEMQRRSMRG